MLSVESLVTVVIEIIPFKIAALPDLIASDEILAITSGRASKMTSKTPSGHVTLSDTRPSSICIREITLPTILLSAKEKPGTK